PLSASFLRCKSPWWPRRPLATLGRKPRQGRKAATVSIDAGAEVSWRGHRLSWRSTDVAVGLKRAYEAPADSDGMRVLVDRLWPRGVSKAAARIDLWLKDVAPSTELRKWFGHDPEKWPEFQKRYRAELKGSAALAELRRLARQGHVTLVYGAKDEARNDAVVLAKLLRR